jgi:membrane protease YdiL (CAAX protease family)
MNSVKTATHSARVVALIAALVIFGNAKAWWDLVALQTTAAGSTFGIGAGIALVLAILVISCFARVDPAALGLAGGSWRASLRLGLWIGGTAAVAGAALIIGGSLAARSLGLRLVDVTPAASVPWGPLLWRALLLLWVDTCIPEELGFRGALLLALDGQNTTSATVEPPSYRQAWVQVGRAAIRPAVIGSSIAFAAWHVVVVVQDGVPDLVTITGKLLVIAIGGLLFGGLRVVGRNLLAPIVGHWLFDMAAMVAARFAAGL